MPYKRECQHIEQRETTLRCQWKHTLVSSRKSTWVVQHTCPWFDLRSPGTLELVFLQTCERTSASVCFGIEHEYLQWRLVVPADDVVAGKETGSSEVDHISSVHADADRWNLQCLVWERKKYSKLCILGFTLSFGYQVPDPSSSYNSPLTQGSRLLLRTRTCRGHLSCWRCPERGLRRLIQSEAGVWNCGPSPHWSQPNFRTSI